MRIFSQDRADIVNFDNVISISVKGNLILAGQGRVEVTLGRYSSYDIAKSVLESIFNQTAGTYVMPNYF